MKKLITALTICVAGMALAADVTSQNIVGYAGKTAVANGWTLLGCNWEKVTGGGLTFVELIGSETELLDGDMVQVYSPSAPASTYTYYAPDWYDGDGYIASPTVTVSSAVWFFHDGPAMTFTFAGQVVKADVAKTLLANTWSQFAASTPIGFNPADTALVTWASLEDGSMIQRYLTPSSSLSFTYYSPDWYDGDGYTVTTPIAAIGEGLWFFNASPTVDATLTQHAPSGL